VNVDPMNTAIVGVDVGGTMMAAGVVTCAGDVIVDERAPTRGGTAGDPLDAIVASIRRVTGEAERRRYTIGAIGVGVPGPVDAARGRVGEPVNHVPQLAGRPLAEELTAQVGLPIFLDNDVNALALGELMFGAGRGARSIVVLAAGTGFGAGIVLDGRLVRGAVGFGGELGHVPIRFDGPRCWCGGRGCLALYASGRGIADAARARAAGGESTTLTAQDVFRAAARGDAVAASVVDEACQAIGAMIGTVVNGLNPEVVVVTGGVARSLVPLEARIRAAAAEYAFATALAATRVVIVTGDKRVGVRGAAALALYERDLMSRGISA
jgi:glucokinase